MCCATLLGVAIIVTVAFGIFIASIKILRQFERAVVFTLGRFQLVKGPWLILIIPFI
jgi:regulator of protease activity HflC (stomatin/prohibitin superfamily)